LSIGDAGLDHVEVALSKDMLGPKANLENEDDDEYEDETSGDLCFHQSEPKVSELGAVYFSDHSRWLAGWVYTLAEPSFADL
jgi:hypothetical protein